MDNIQYQEFNNELFGQIRCINEDGIVLFCANDIARALGYTNPQKATRDHCKGVTKRSGVSYTTNQHKKTTEQITTMNFISEGDVYRLIMRSKLPAAEEFEHWVMDDVLPTMRKTGGYVVTDELFLDTYFPGADDNVRVLLKTTMATLRQQSVQLEEQAKTIMEQKPAMDYVEAVSSADKLLTIRDFAKVLYDKETIDIGEIRLFAWLRRNKFLDKKNMPYQEFLTRDYFRMIQRVRYKHPRTPIPYTVTLVTGKGQVYLTRKLLDAPPEDYNSLKSS